MSDQKMKMWFCKVGEIDPAKLPASGADEAMREAVERKYEELTGEEATFTFSGWGGELDEGERAVVENRIPDFFKTGWMEHRLHELRVYLRADEELPGDWSDQQWITTVMMKLGEAALYLGDDAKTDHTRRLGVECLMATAAACLDAVEMMEREEPRAKT